MSSRPKPSLRCRHQYLSVVGAVARSCGPREQPPGQSFELTEELLDRTLSASEQVLVVRAGQRVVVNKSSVEFGAKGFIFLREHHELVPVFVHGFRGSEHKVRGDRRKVQETLALNFKLLGVVGKTRLPLGKGSCYDTKVMFENLLPECFIMGEIREVWKHRWSKHSTG